MSDTAYTTRYTSSFPISSRMRHYNTDIVDDAEQGARAKAESAYNVKKADYDMYVSACRKTSKFILAVVEDMWVRKLRLEDH